jgi:serine phosphatase RsbU (regulator of sigma subunit)
MSTLTPSDIGVTFSDEMRNLRSILNAVYGYPSTFGLKNVDVYGRSWPLAGELGGDHLIFVDFARRYDLDRRIQRARAEGLPEVASNLEANRGRIGVLVADVAGHSMTDALLAAMLHQAFLVGVLYELEHHGHVTVELFEILNTRFYQSSSVTKYLTMIYGEIAEDGTFRFISAGHPSPLVYSARYGRFVELDHGSMVSVHPIGMFPTEGDVDGAVSEAPAAVSPQPRINELRLLGSGDVLLLYTDGAEDLTDGALARALEPTMRSVFHHSAAEIVGVLHAELMRGRVSTDDVSLVVIKRK